MTELKWIKAPCDSGMCVEVAFTRSSRCSSGECVEVARGDEILVRNSQHPDGPRLSFGTGAWRDFIDAIKNNEI